MSSYAASKAATRSWTESLQHELIPLGVNVMLIEPGVIGTHLNTSSESELAWQPRPDALYVGGDFSIPKSYREAISGTNSERWKLAMDEELNSIKAKGVFTPIIHVPSGRRPIGSRWVFAVKSDGRFKAR